MHILIAPNAFKNSLKAADVANAIKEGFDESALQCTCHCFPVGDGGDGTVELIVQHCKGTTVSTQVHDPLRRIINSSFGLIDDNKTAVIEMADASGLRLLNRKELDPLHTTSLGTGELMKAAFDKAVTKIILCIGGSATVDGGAGILQALGVRFLDKEGNDLSNLPDTMTQLETIDLSGLDKRIMNCELIILCDVENFLLGDEGAAAVFGPQKGASPDDVIKLDASLSKLRDVVFKQTGKDMSLIKHGGAAGGIAAGLAAVLNAQIVNGIKSFLSLTGFDTAIQKADLVITGEGSIDIQTLQGKGPFGVAKKAKEKNVPVIGLAGKIPSEIPAALQEHFDVLLSINNEPMEISLALANTYTNLKRTSRSIGEMLAMRIN